MLGAARHERFCFRDRQNIIGSLSKWTPIIGKTEAFCFIKDLQMKVLTKLFVLCVALASLWYGTGPAKAAWKIDIQPSQGYPIQQANGGSGDVLLKGGPTFPNPLSVTSDESCSTSGPSGTSAFPNYDNRYDVACTWDSTAPPTPLTLTFTASASASFSNNNSESYGYASAGASTNAASVQAGVSVSSGSSTDSPPSQTVTYSGTSPYKFYLDANSSASGYIYGGNSTGGNSSFTAGSSSSITLGF